MDPKLRAWQRILNARDVILKSNAHEDASYSIHLT